MNKKGIALGLWIVFSLSIQLFLLPQIMGAGQVVQVAQETPKEEGGFFSNTFGFLKSPIFWYIVLGFFLIIGLLIGIFFLVKWLVKYFKSRSDIFWMLKSERINLAKIQKRYPSKSWFKITKNTPIRLVRNEGGKMIISHPIAYHRGDYTSHEGNYVICMNLINNNKWFIMPITDLLVIPDREKIDITRKNDKGKVETITINNLPRARDIVQFNENEILIYAESLSNMGMFYVPVLKAKDGKIIDLSLPVYQSMRDVVMGEYLFSQTDEFTKVTKKSMDLNPNLRYAIKTQDSASSSVDVPQSNN
jgi:hypothetical protein